MQEAQRGTAVNEALADPKDPPRGLTGAGRIVRDVSTRRRLTPAIAKQQKSPWLVDTYEGAADTLRRVSKGDMQLGPATLARVKKIYSITRAELVRRGATKEELDYEPESPEAELQEETPAAL